jgi:hypothetical protein
VPTRLWLERLGGFPVSSTTVVPDAGHFVIAEHMAQIVREI